MTHPILYSFRRCPYAMRARLALLSGGVPFILREVSLKDKPAAFTDLSPKATVPVLQLSDGVVLEESIDIVRWIFDGWRDRHGERHAWDLYEAPADRKAIDKFADDFENDFKVRSDGYKYGDNKEDDFAVAVEFLKTCELRLQENVYLFGDTPSLADIVALPFFRQFSRVDEVRFEGLDLPAVQARLRSFLACRLFGRVMQKATPWQASDAEIPQAADFAANLES